MQPAAVDSFLKHYAVEFNKLNVYRHQEKSGLEKRLKGIDTDIACMMNAIKLGIITPSTKDELKRLEAEESDLQTKLVTATDSLPDIHPGIAKLYRQKVDSLIESLNAEETRTEAAEAVRSLLDKVIIKWDAESQDHRVEIQGEFAALLGLADNKNAASYKETASSLKLVSGAGFGVPPIS